MYWGKNKHVIRHATQEQQRIMSMAGVRARELKRLSAEPHIYAPFGNKIAGFCIAVNCQYDDHFIDNTVVLMDSGNVRQDSYQAIVNGKSVLDNHGWHYWLEQQAKAMQLKFLQT